MFSNAVSSTTSSSCVPICTSVLSSSNLEFDPSLKFDTLKELEMYIDAMAMFGGWEWRVGSCDAIEMTLKDYKSHAPRLISCYRSRRSIRAGPLDSQKHNVPQNLDNDTEDMDMDDERQIEGEIRGAQVSSQAAEELLLQLNSSETGVHVDNPPQHNASQRIIPHHYISQNVLPPTLKVNIARRFECVRSRTNSYFNASNMHRATHSKKCNCTAFINVAYHRSEFRWVINKFNLTHNHILFPLQLPIDAPKRIQHYRDLTDEMKQWLRERWREGLRNPNLRFSFLNHFKVGWIHDNVLRNFVTTLRKEVGGGQSNETQLLFDWITQLKNVKMRFKHDASHRLLGLFLMFEQQVNIIKLWPEVLIVDATYKTNRFSFQLVILTVIDDEYNSQAIAIALIAKEDHVNYNWIFESLNICVGAPIIRQVKSVVTDGDTSFPLVLSTQIPHAQHLLCTWHIGCNVKRHLSHHFLPTQDVLYNKFNTAMYTTDKAVFEQLWQELKERISSNTWFLSYLQKLFDSRAQWAQSYTSQRFNLGVKTTSRNEGFNRLLTSTVDKGTSLLQLFQFFKDTFDSQYNRRCQFITHTLSVAANSRVEMQTEEEYWKTLVSFYAVEHLLKQQQEMGKYSVTEVPRIIPHQGASHRILAHLPYMEEDLHQPDDLDYVICHVERLPDDFQSSQASRDHDFRVTTVSRSGMPHCSCNFPTQYGLPCRHVLAVNSQYYKIRPIQLYQIAARWTLDHRNSIQGSSNAFSILHPNGSFDQKSNNLVINSTEPSVLVPTTKELRASAFMGAYREVCDLAIRNRRDYTYAMSTLNMVKITILKNKAPLDQKDEEIKSTQNTDATSVTVITNPSSNIVIANPPHASNIRKGVVFVDREGEEAVPSRAAKRKITCSECKQDGHSKRSLSCTARTPQNTTDQPIRIESDAL